MMARGFGHYGGRFAQGGFARPMFFPGGGLLMFLLFAAIAALVVVAFWRIFSKAGFPGVLSLLMLVPLVNIGVIVYLAFAEWPALKRPVTEVPAVAPAPVAPAAPAAPPMEEPAVAPEDEAGKGDA